MSEERASALPGILYVDDETKALKYFEKAFAKEYRVFTSEDAAGGMEILAKEGESISIVVSDQRMPGTTGVEFLTEVRGLFPDKIRILTTAYSDLDSAIQSVNQGRIYQYVVKPWDLQEFGMILRRAQDFFTILSERNQLMSLKMSTFQRIVLADRTKCLAALAVVLGEGRAAALRAALYSFVKALPRELEAAPAAAGGAFVRGGLRELLGQERAAVAAVAGFFKECADGPEESLAAFVEGLRTGLAGGEPMVCEISAGESGPRVTVDCPAERIGELWQAVFGVLTAASPPDPAVRLFHAVGSLAAAGRSLAFVVRSPGGGEASLRFEPGVPEPLSVLEEELALVYDRWDTLALGN